MLTAAAGHPPCGVFLLQLGREVFLHVLNVLPVLFVLLDRVIIKPHNDRPTGAQLALPIDADARFIHGAREPAVSGIFKIHMAANFRLRVPQRLRSGRRLVQRFAVDLNIIPVNSGICPQQKRPAGSGLVNREVCRKRTGYAVGILLEQILSCVICR